MLVSGRAPDNVACTDFDAGFAVALSPAASGRNDEGLTKRMGMPVGSCAGFKGNACAGDARRRRGRVYWVETYRASEPFFRPLPGRL